MFVEIRLHGIIIRRARFAKRIPLDGMRELTVLVQTPMAGVAFGGVGPGDDAVVVATHEPLAVADGCVALVGRHGGVVAVAEHVFAEEVQTVLGVVGVEGRGAFAFEVDEVLADVFLGQERECLVLNRYV